MSLIDGLALYLETKGLVTYSAGNIDCFLERLPPTPLTSVAITGFGGPVPDPKEPYRTLHVQIWVRGGRDSQVTAARAMGILDALHGLSQIDLADADATHVVSIYAQEGAPLPLGADSGGHFEYSLNFLIEVVHPTPATPYLGISY